MSLADEEAPQRGKVEVLRAALAPATLEDFLARYKPTEDDFLVMAKQLVRKVEHAVKELRNDA